MNEKKEVIFMGGNLPQITVLTTLEMGTMSKQFSPIEKNVFVTWLVSMSTVTNGNGPHTLEQHF